MPIAGFHFSKLTAERTKLFEISDQIATDVKITEILLEEIGSPKESLVKFIFTFNTTYGRAGKTEIEGQVLYIEETTKAKKVVEDWKKEKKTDVDLIRQVLNTILYRCNIKCLEIANEVGLPPHFDLPRFDVNQTPAPEKK